MRPYFFLALWLCLISAPALADSKEQAQILRDQAIELAKADNCQEAIKLFQQAYDVNTEAKDLYNIGSCYINTDQYADALRTFELYLSRLSEDDEQLRVNTEQLKRLAEKLQRPELQKAGKAKTQTLVEQADSLSKKAENLPPPITITEPPSTLPVTETPPKTDSSLKKFIIPGSLVGVSALCSGGAIFLYSKSKKETETTDAREILRIGLEVGAGLSLLSAGATLALALRKNPKESTTPVAVGLSVSPRGATLMVSF
jgi:tetratricopeptide (TPR) repeat protein